MFHPRSSQNRLFTWYSSEKPDVSLTWQMTSWLLSGIPMWSEQLYLKCMHGRELWTPSTDCLSDITAENVRSMFWMLALCTHKHTHWFDNQDKIRNWIKFNVKYERCIMLCFGITIILSIVLGICWRVYWNIYVLE